eukprot:jgi/Tetstr1/454698/TSEL_041584.t1
MLHRSILPFHAQFARILANLRYVVVDEGHYYSGVFGAHTALVLRRLRRLCARRYNSAPRFIVTSATMANPLSHAQELLGVAEVAVIKEDGSPQGPKSFVLWNPPLSAPAAVAKPAGHPSHRLQQQTKRDLKRTANQERARGSQLGRHAEEGSAEWLAAVKVGKRQGTPPGSRCPPSRERRSWAGGAEGGVLADAAKARASQPVRCGPAVGTAPAAKRTRRLRLEAQRAVQAVSAPAGGRPPPSSDAWFRARGGAGRRGRRGAANTGPPPATADGGGAAEGSGSGGDILLKGTPGAISLAEMTALRERVEEKVKARTAALRESEVQYGAAGVAAHQRRRSPMVEIATLVAECVQHNVRTLAFCMTRKLCELVVAYTRDILRVNNPELTELVAVYRSGYSAQERRDIERRLHDGRLRAVCATNAMELGVDVGELGATLHLGFAGSISSLWQQAGRAGRRGQHSLAIYVAFDGALDQYFMQHPQYLFGRPIEHTALDSRNPQLLLPHIVCAAAEDPLHLDLDDAFFGSGMADVADKAVAQGLLARHPGLVRGLERVLYYVGKPELYAAEVNLRTIDPNRFTIVNEADGGAVMEEVEENKAFWQVYPGAVYYHQGRSYLCKSLDLSRRVAV